MLNGGWIESETDDWVESPFNCFENFFQDNFFWMEKRIGLNREGTTLNLPIIDSKLCRRDFLLCGYNQTLNLLESMLEKGLRLRIPNNNWINQFCLVFQVSAMYTLPSFVLLPHNLLQALSIYCINKFWRICFSRLTSSLWGKFPSKQCCTVLEGTGGAGEKKTLKLLLTTQHVLVWGSSEIQKYSFAQHQHLA